MSLLKPFPRPYRAWLAALAALASLPAHAITLREHARDHEIVLFLPTKGAVMPNPHDDPGHLKADTPALLLSGLALSNLEGISTLTVTYRGKRVPVTSVPKLHVYVNDNGLTALPDELGRMQNVEFLYCERNRLSALPPGLARMKGLTAMYFTSNEFTGIPALVFEMTWLRKLQFSKNRISVLPAAIGRLDELRHLSVAGNLIEELPGSIARLTKLRVCDLSDNRLTTIPEAFGGVRIVNQLRVRNNPLTSLPAGFAQMRATIDITGTRIDPAAVAPELRAKFSTEKPPGSKDEDAILVVSPKKPRERTKP